MAEVKTADGLAWIEQGPGIADAGVPVLFLHGLGGTSGSWKPQLAHFARARRCLAWDMPGYGDSRAVHPLTYEAIADRMVDLLDAAAIERVDLVGLSFGGMHALHAALRYPQRINKMVLANTSPAFGIDGTDPDAWRRGRVAPLDAGETPRSLAPTVLDALVAKPLASEIRGDLVAAFGRISAEGLRAAVTCLPDNDVRDRLHQIAQECLVIAGEFDRETPVSYAKILADGLANARLEVLPGIGHLSPSEDPVAFNTLVEEFLG